MKAARLYELGKPLKVEEVPEPVLRSGGAIVRVLRAPILSFAGQVFSGELGYMLPPLPFTPGPSAIGVVEAVADDVFGLQVGQKVFCDPLISSQTQGGQPDSILIGWTGLAAASPQMQSLWKDGTSAEKILWPGECLTPLEDTETIDLNQLACLGYLTIPYGGFLRGELRPGQTLIVNGATGNLGAAAVLVALAMGVSKIVVVGRDRVTLEKLVQLDPKRVVTASLSGNAAEYTERISEAAGGADMVLDVLGGVSTPEPTVACINALRPRGTAVFLGGVKAEIPLSYPKIMHMELTITGAHMFPRQAPKELLRMITAGMLKLDAIQTHAFKLDDISHAIDKAAKLKGLEYCVLVPNTQ
ncbi:MAG: zinc-binding alcohol dehydrogenase family protein [Brasilonema octagenarum HA4186-MV1]|jgi:alcohol dehydrogenase|uniref:Alcohol dehydrogenase n=2 Tax=Brasilonema TaxID=383614 RepID=A0A856MMR1_9CYAN|nr:MULTISPECIES: zinc-binding alcohol dehydrogenase family protein [Brasilonema]MBW4625748.1 zinc-binding alcohol dehydrogenase family protein [Brasilonema octagenarum HA4186-MV1]QDL17722.1 alcohol dehydrogenase [Brasilonema octagenarum UFV-E1]NMF65615.1 alcohol dehydrogenase [Brasilonema octagenarum UFV-OR1]QDL11380.1 alcohol dehydrogenase [Brasilonema sennae CENA114]QDL17771.1 alcohol dehydrogenase [Brasilonema octagenarum UFV-E1]